MGYIYYLYDPRNEAPRYIGQTCDFKKRLKDHIRDIKRTHKTNWVNSLKKDGVLPKMEILDEVSKEELNFWEYYYICLFKSWGFKLTNSTNGGDNLRTVNPAKFKKPIKQYGKDGVFIKEWSSRSQAIKELKIARGEVSTACNNPKRSAGGFMWMDPSYPDVISPYKRCGWNLGKGISKEEKFNRKKAYRLRTRPKKGKGAVIARMKGADNPGKKQMKPVLQYDLNGNFVREWECAAFAGKELGFLPENIGRAARGIHAQSKGFIWKYKQTADAGAKINNI